MSIVNINEKNITTVLVEPRDDANIGAVARGLKNCGTVNLHLVRKRKPGARALRMAVHSEDVLQGARRFIQFNDALEGMDLAAGFTARARKFGPKLQMWNSAAAAELLKFAERKRVALIFGPEDSGLSDEHVARCARIYQLPASPARPIYNLSQAVLIVHFTLAFGFDNNSNAGSRRVDDAPAPLPAASRLAIDGLSAQFQQLLALLDYPPARRPHDRTSRIEARFRTQMERACAEPADVQMWRGLLSRMLQNKARSR